MIDHYILHINLIIHIKYLQQIRILGKIISRYLQRCLLQFNIHENLTVTTYGASNLNTNIKKGKYI